MIANMKLSFSILHYSALCTTVSGAFGKAAFFILFPVLAGVRSILPSAISTLPAFPHSNRSRDVYLVNSLPPSFCSTGSPHSDSFGYGFSSVKHFELNSK
ncbi:hypothetical protein VNO78_08544 [Psophocarpus tetragonolobus]|uniref:Uncharacterized protein n=1 Tax=Psophocarpus tetragonolobus TaxID=3891 RepID=A0AAN9T5F0_PSOTE